MFPALDFLLLQPWRLIDSSSLYNITEYYCHHNGSSYGKGHQGRRRLEKDIGALDS